MSEERRRKQQERMAEDQPASRRKIAVAGLVVLAFAVTLLFANQRRHRYDDFARCLTEKGVKMYGLYWCEHCAQQEEMFGASFKYVPYVECGIKGQRGEQPVCKDAGVKLFPTWQFPDGQRHEGVLPLDSLSRRSGCSLP
jgi:hypothetical protein